MNNAWLISFIRIPLLFVVLIFLFLLLKLFGFVYNFSFLPEFSTIYFSVVNVVCFFLMHRLLKKEGRSIKELINFRVESLGKDILFGFLWLFILYIPFVITVTGTMFLMYGTDFINHFQTVFIGNMENGSIPQPKWLMWLAAGISLIFPFLNAPIEELMYRGYTQPLFIKNYQKVWVGVLIPSIGFALQHVVLAASWQGAIVYALAFFVWGIGSGLIYYKQKRLFPLIVCHFIVNIAFSIFPIVFLILGF